MVTKAPELLTEKEVCQMLRISKSTLRRVIRRGRVLQAAKAESRYQPVAQKDSRRLHRSLAAPGWHLKC